MVRYIGSFRHFLTLSPHILTSRLYVPRSQSWPFRPLRLRPQMLQRDPLRGGRWRKRLKKKV